MWIIKVTAGCSEVKQLVFYRARRDTGADLHALRSGLAVLADGSFGHKDDIGRPYGASVGVTAESARRIDTDVVLPWGEGARGSSPEWKDD